MAKIGMRTIKTGVGVTLCSLFSQYLNQSPTVSAVACLISMQDTVSGSLETGFNRIKGTLFGGIIGFLILLLFPGNPLFCGLGIIFTIYACNLLGLNKSISISCVTFLSIQMGFSDSSPAIIYSLNRILDTCIGVIIAIIVNFSLARPNHLSVLYSYFEKVESIIEQYLKYKVLNEDVEFDLQVLTDTMNELETVYNKIVGEISYNRENINLDKVNSIMRLCREVNFHIQSIELLNRTLYLNQNTYDKLRNLYNEDDFVFEVDENQSPVFNYHLVRVIEHSKKIKKENNLYKIDNTIDKVFNEK